MKIPPESSLWPGRGISLKGQFYTREMNGRLFASKWPKSQKAPRNAREADTRRLFKIAANVSTMMSAQEQAFARRLANESKLLPRDFLMIALFNRIGVVVLRNGRKIYGMPAIQDVSAMLDALWQTKGGILYRDTTLWAGLEAGDPGFVLTMGDDAVPVWAEAPSGGGGGWTELPPPTGATPAGWALGAVGQYGSLLPLAPMDLLEVMASGHRNAASGFGLMLSPDGNAAYQIVQQGDNNSVTYRYATFGGAQTLLGAAVAQNFVGNFTLYSRLQVDGGSNNQMVGSYVNGFAPRGPFALTAAQLPVVTAGGVGVYAGVIVGNPWPRVFYRITHGTL